MDGRGRVIKEWKGGERKSDRGVQGERGEGGEGERREREER